MKKILFNKYFLGMTFVTSIIALLLGATIMQDVMDPSRLEIKKLQAMRAHNEVLLLDLQEAHAKLVAERDKVSAQRDQLNDALAKMNATILETEKKGEEIRKENFNLTNKITTSGGKAE